MKLASAASLSAPPSISFADLYESHFEYVYHSLRRLGAPQADLEDVAQEVFLVAYRKLNTFDATRPIRPWLFGIAFRVLSDKRKTRQVSNDHEPLDENQLDAQPFPSQEFEAHEAKQVVTTALNEMDFDRRAVFVLHDVEGETAPDISRTLDVPLNTVYSRLRLARRDFAETVRRLLAQKAIV